MKLRLFIAAFLSLASSSAFAQDAVPPSPSPPVPVPFNAAEKAAVMEMCATAQIAYMIRFSGSCEALRKKFDDAERAVPAPDPKK